MANVDQGHLPHVTVRMSSGMLTELTLDGTKLRGVKAVSFDADVSAGYPTVTIELWATVEMSGEIATTIHQDRFVARCTRPHIGDIESVPTPAAKTAVQPSSDDSRGSTQTSALLRRGSTSSGVPDGYPAQEAE